MDDSMTFWCISNSSFCATWKFPEGTPSYKSLMKLVPASGLQVQLPTSNQTFHCWPPLSRTSHSDSFQFTSHPAQKLASDAHIGDTIFLPEDWIGNITASCSFTRQVIYSKFITALHHGLWVYTCVVHLSDPFAPGVYLPCSRLFPCSLGPQNSGSGSYKTELKKTPQYFLSF